MRPASSVPCVPGLRLALAAAVLLHGCGDGWPGGVRAVRIPSTRDTSSQAALFYAPEAGAPKPLVVQLHPWKEDYRDGTARETARWCRARGWAFIQPDARGPNDRPESGGSDLVLSDIADAVAFARARTAVDPRRIYLVGVSGGGFTALLAAAAFPDLWAAVSVWVPVTDLTSWHRHCRARGLPFAAMVEKVCGGPPDPGTPAEAECRRRSPVERLASARGLPVDIHAGIRDGREGPVPVEQGMRAFNVLAGSIDRFTEAEMEAVSDSGRVPAAWAPVPPDKREGPEPILHRRESGRARFTLFDGGHAWIPEAALPWLEGKARP